MSESSRRGGGALGGSPADYARISLLLDESIDMKLEERIAWRAGLELNEPRFAAILREIYVV